ncbi:hypothetical protein C8J56DRAFT_904065 [Mycena floridula]|nr:hypothetical protein C8J56DRAFT_904065 [Mycena floridula]
MTFHKDNFDPHQSALNSQYQRLKGSPSVIRALDPKDSDEYRQYVMIIANVIKGEAPLGRYWSEIEDEFLPRIMTKIAGQFPQRLILTEDLAELQLERHTKLEVFVGHKYRNMSKGMEYKGTTLNETDDEDKDDEEIDQHDETENVAQRSFRKQPQRTAKTKKLHSVEIPFMPRTCSPSSRKSSSCRLGARALTSGSASSSSSSSGRHGKKSGKLRSLLQQALENCHLPQCENELIIAGYGPDKVWYGYSKNLTTDALAYSLIKVAKIQASPADAIRLAQAFIDIIQSL